MVAQLQSLINDVGLQALTGASAADLNPWGTETASGPDVGGWPVELGAWDDPAQHAPLPGEFLKA